MRVSIQVGLGVRARVSVRVSVGSGFFFLNMQKNVQVAGGPEVTLKPDHVQLLDLIIAH